MPIIQPSREMCERMNAQLAMMREAFDAEQDIATAPEDHKAEYRLLAFTVGRAESPTKAIIPRSSKRT